jgi:hypothetical protein
VVSDLYRAGYGHGSRRNVRRAAPSLLPPKARDDDNIAFEECSVNHFLAEIQTERVGRLQILRYVVVLVTGIIAGSRMVDAVQAWREWRSWAATDISRADGYRTYFLTNTASATLSLAIAALVWWLLRPHARR